MATLTRTGETVPFCEIRIGGPFHYHGRYWTRSTYDAGTDLAGGPGSFGSCSFFVAEDAIEEGDGQTPGWIAVEKVEIQYPEKTR